MNETLIEQFLQMMSAEKGAAANTLEAYRRDMELFFELCSQQEVGKITKADLSAYVQELSKQAYAPRSICRKISSLREFFKFLYTEKLVKDNLAIYLMPPKREKSLPKFLSDAEVRKMIEASVGATAYVYDWKENLNPISMIFRMLRKNPDELRSKWGKMDIIFLGQTGYFKVDFSKFDRKDLNKFKIRLEKLYRGENIEKDPDEDGYTYGQNADVSDSDSSAAIAVKLVDKIEASSGITVDNVSKAV